MEKYIIADVINGVYVQEYLDGDEERIFDNIEDFIDSLRDQKKIAIFYQKSYIEKIINAGCGINDSISTVEY